MRKCVFLDRDGVINEDDPNYTYEISKFKILPGVLDALRLLKEKGFLLVICTNQSGIAKGIYTIDQVNVIHEYLQKQCNNAIDKFYFSPYHRSVSASLLTKPESLMYEKGIAKFDVDVTKSWGIGDNGRDIVPPRALGMRTIQVGDKVFEPAEQADYKFHGLLEAAQLIVSLDT